MKNWLQYKVLAVKDEYIKSELNTRSSADAEKPARCNIIQREEKYQQLVGRHIICRGNINVLEVVVTKSCKAPFKSSPPTNQRPVFYRPDALPVTQPTVSKHWRENITFHGLAYPKLAWGGVFQLCLWPLMAPGYLGGGLPCLSSALWCQYSIFSLYKQSKMTDYLLCHGLC